MRGLPSSLILNFSTTAFGLLSGILLARGLGPEGRGEVTQIMYWAQFIFGLSHLSIGEALLISSKEETTSKALFRQAIITALITSIPQAVTCGIVILFYPSQMTREAASLAALYAITYIPLMTIFVYCSALIQADLQLVKFNMARTAIGAIYTAGLCALVLTNQLHEVTATLCSMASILVGTAYVVNETRSRRSGQQSKKSSTKSLLKIATPFHITTSLITLNSQIDRVFVVALFPTIQVGQYIVAWTAGSGIAGVVSQAVHTITFPSVASESSATKRYQLAKRAILLTLALSGTLGLASILLMPKLIPLLFGQGFSDAITTAQILTIGWIAVSLRQVASRIAKAAELNKQNVLIEVCFLASYCAIAYAFSTGSSTTFYALLFLLANSVIGGIQLISLMTALKNATRVPQASA